MTKAEIKDNTKIKPNEEEIEKDKENKIKSVSNASPWVSFLFKDILRGFVSAPLTFHFSNFSIAISLDSILWEFIIGRFLQDTSNNKKDKEKKKEETDKNPGTTTN